MWPSKRLTELLGIKHPIIQAPMAGANDAEMARAVSNAGGLGSLPCAMLTPAQVRTQYQQLDANYPLNLNFLCHTPTPAKNAERWVQRLAPLYAEFGITLDSAPAGQLRTPFNEPMCELVEELQPNVVSFHFGLPTSSLLQRVKASGAVVLSSATTVEEAIWLEHHGCDAVIAQGAEAGGHRGMFLDDDIATQVGTIALVPQVADAVKIPVIASGGISDPRGIVAALALGADGVQLGTAYLFTPQATISDAHRRALSQATSGSTALTNVFSGKPARGIMNRAMRELGPMSNDAPAFPTAGFALAPLKASSEADFASLWSGQAAALATSMDAQELTRHLASAALELLQTA